MRHSVKQLTHKQWIDLREGTTHNYLLSGGGIGGSEIGAMLNKDKYKSKLELHLQKIGEPVFKFIGNKYTHEGTYAEKNLRELSQYYSVGAGTEGMWSNYHGKRKLRTSRANGYMVQHKKHPHLFLNLDGDIIEDDRKGVLECKCTTSYSARNFKDGINPSHVAQLQYYINFKSSDFGLLFQRIDGVDYEMFPFDPMKELWEHIVEESYEFWMNVEKARAIKAHFMLDSYYGHPIEYYNSEKQEGIAMLQELEPELIGSKPETEFLDEYILPQSDRVEVEGGEDLLQLAQEFHIARKEKETADQRLNHIKAKIKLAMAGHTDVVYDVDGRKAKISFYKDNGGRQQLRVSNLLAA